MAQVLKGLEGGGELLCFQVAQGDDDLAGTLIASQDLHVPAPTGVVRRGAVLAGLELVGAHYIPGILANRCSPWRLKSRAVRGRWAIRYR